LKIYKPSILRKYWNRRRRWRKLQNRTINKIGQRIKTLKNSSISKRRKNIENSHQNQRENSRKSQSKKTPSIINRNYYYQFFQRVIPPRTYSFRRYRLPIPS
jgi:hypothetical protein